MRLIIFSLLLIAINTAAQTKECDDKLGYTGEGDLASKGIIKGYLSKTDTALKFFIRATLIKTKMTNGIFFLAFFSKIGTVDKSTEMKITFSDESVIFVKSYGDEKSEAGIFGGVITDKYRLLLLKTKLIIKVAVTGDFIDSTTYYIDFSAIDFMLGMECLEGYL